VIPFQTTAPVRAAPSTNTISSSGTVTMPAMVSATAVPTTTAPSILKTAASATA
jgi:hypothetical protein